MLVQVTVDTSALPPHTEEQLLEWLRWEMGVSGSMRMDNPLNDCDLTATNLTVRK